MVLDRKRDEDSFGGPDERAGNNSIIAAPCPTPYPTPGDPMASNLVNHAMGHLVVLRELDAAGDEKPVYNHRQMQVSGCPFCGTRANQI